MAFIYVEEGEYEIEIRFEYSITPGCSAKLNGLPENCYPAEPAELDEVYDEEIIIDKDLLGEPGYMIAVNKVRELLNNGDLEDEFDKAAFEDVENGDY